MDVWYMIYDGLIYAIWCFDICLYMVCSICFRIFFGIWFGICFGIYTLMMFLYVFLCMDVNTIMSFAIKIHYAISLHVVMMFFFEHVIHCKYYNELSYKAPWAVCFLFSSFAEVLVWFNTEDGVPQGAGFCNNLDEISMQYKLIKVK